VTDRVLPGRVVILAPDDAERFPVGTIVTETRDGTYRATVPIHKTGERPQFAYVFALAGETIAQLAARVREQFPPLPPLPE
jgi:hypothetical protein